MVQVVCEECRELVQRHDSREKIFMFGDAVTVGSILKLRILQQTCTA